MTFADLNLSKNLLKALEDVGYTTPTTIQSRAFSVVMSGKDMIGIAQTGTGKTLAYLLPCLRQLEYQKERVPRILIIVPTRELVVQVVREAEKLTKYMGIAVAGVFGGTNIKSQQIIINNGVDVLVATPGRLLDFALNGTLKMKSIKRLIIDEVDEMLNLGFRPQLTRILDLLPQRRQNLMFSATMTEDVEQLIDIFFQHPQRIEAAPTGTPLENILQEGYKVPNFYTKINLLRFVLTQEAFKKVLVFAATKQLADELFEECERKFKGSIGVIHSNKAQNNRFETVRKFHLGEYRILIATDIIARGLDISEVTHVINFDVPEVPEIYMHRIGRTGRADKRGNAITFFTPAESKLMKEIEKLMKVKVPLMPLPEAVEVSKVLRPEEIPQVKMKNTLGKEPKRDFSGPSFHEKKAKNTKVNVRKNHAEEMMKKYGKRKTRGQKK